MRKYLKREELEALIHSAKRPRDRLIIKLLYETGLRVGELVALDITDIDFEAEELTVQTAKRHREGRTVPLIDDWTSLMLAEYIGERKTGPIFMSNKRGRISRRQIERMISDCGAAINLDVDKRHPHVLRHTHAINALNSGIDLRTLRDNLGHSTIRTTSIYLASATDLAERKGKYKRLFAALPAEPEEPIEEAKNDYLNSFVIKM